MENEVLKAIKERRSIRRFKSDQITDEELKPAHGQLQAMEPRSLSSLPFRILRFAPSFAR